jgi:hypothetical protein
VPLEANFVRFQVSRAHPDKTVNVRFPKYTYMGFLKSGPGIPVPELKELLGQLSWFKQANQALELGACPKRRRLGEDPRKVQETLLFGDAGVIPTRRSSSFETRVP